MKRDEVLDRIDKARANLIKIHGGWKGYMDHLMELDRQRLEKEKRKAAAKLKRKRAAKATTTG